MAKAIGVPSLKRGAFRAALRQLEKDGQIRRLRKNRWGRPDPSRETLGRLFVTPQGLGFVTPEISGTPDIVIDKDALGTALHGDRVAVELSGRSAGHRGKDLLRGRLLRVVERRMKAVAGLLRQSKYYWYVIPINPRIPQQVRVREFAPGIPHPPEFHQVVVSLDENIPINGWLTGVVTEDLGTPDQPGVDMLAILRSRSIESDFSDDVLAAAQQQPTSVTERERMGRLDLRSQLTITIDPADAKDFDDAVSLDRSADGTWQVGVHIADVAHFVPLGSAVDLEARQRGNSVYMVDRFIPMLPKYLTSDVCSLRPDVDRLAHSVLLTLDTNGDVLKSQTARTVIHSSARLNYDQVQAFMDGRPDSGVPDSVSPMLRQMTELARALRSRRMSVGALDLAMPEVKCELDSEGRVLNIHKRGAPEAYHLIEEFMLCANVAVAEFIARKAVPALYRIHEEPSEEQWAAMSEALEALNIHAAPQDRADLRGVLRSIAGTPKEYAGNLAVLRNLKRALYSPELIEHFGLAFEKYTHFTSPIRRYPDLVVHRILNALEDRKPPPYSHHEIATIAAHCSETERNADEAEEESLIVKRIAFYAEKLHRGETGPFDALVVSMSPRGLVVELLETLQRGMVAFASMRDDYYTFDRARGRATGRRRRRQWMMGQVLKVELVRVDVYRRLVDFECAGEEAPATGRRSKPKKERRHQRRR